MPLTRFYRTATSVMLLPFVYINKWVIFIVVVGKAFDLTHSSIDVALMQSSTDDVSYLNYL
jgi:hypothetical protein